MNKKPRLSFWQIWNMSFGFLGIQFGFGLQNANVSRIFETLGANVEDIPILWVAAPVTGLVIQPIIGHMSDKTWNRLGRRRPFFLVGAIAASLALIIMPNSPALWVAAGMLWIMDASINISMEPFRAFVGDMLPNSQRTAGFAMQSFFIGIGAVVASALPWMMTNWFNIDNTAPAGQIADSVKFSFYIGGAVFLIAVLYTVFFTKEYSPEQLEEFEKAEAEELGSSSNLVSKNLADRDIKYYRNGLIWIVIGFIFTWLIFSNKLEKELYVASLGCVAFGITQLIAGLMKKNNTTKNGFYEVISDMFNMPKTMGQLAVVQFFSWFALFAMWIYTTSAVTAFHYGTTDTTSAAYNDGADWVGVLFGIYNGVAAIAAFIIVGLARITTRKIAHSICLIFGGIGLSLFYFISDPNLLWIAEIGIGFAWASILSMPYAMLTSSLPSNKMGVYMGIFNFFIVIPQILAASILGFLVKNFFDGQAIYALLLGGGSMIIAAIATHFVEDKYAH
jgi:maltose/moltooligosaccharide transporter